MKSFLFKKIAKDLRRCVESKCTGHHDIEIGRSCYYQFVGVHVANHIYHNLMTWPRCQGLNESTRYMTSQIALYSRQKISAISIT